jgi:hypothetical protein
VSVLSHYLEQINTVVTASNNPQLTISTSSEQTRFHATRSSSIISRRDSSENLFQAFCSGDVDAMTSFPAMF